MNRLTKLALAAAALSLTAAAAQAQTYTFQSTQTKMVATGGTEPDGTPFGGSFQTGTKVVTMAGGKSVSETWTCIGVTQPPRDSVFHMNAVCDSTGPSGDAATVWGCNFINRERTEISCVGGIYGKTGAYAGKRGTVTFHGVNGTGSGTGQWNN